MAVQMRTMLEVADNSGARKLQMILPLGGGTGKIAHLGDVFTAAVKDTKKSIQVDSMRIDRERRGKDKEIPDSWTATVDFVYYVAK